MEQATSFRGEMAIPLVSVAGLGAGTALDPEIPRRRKMLSFFIQLVKIREMLTYMEPARPKATIPSINTLMARPHVPGASLMHGSRII